MLVVAKLANRKWYQKTLAYRYSSESTPQELSNEYQHDRAALLSKIFASLCFGRK